MKRVKLQRSYGVSRVAIIALTLSLSLSLSLAGLSTSHAEEETTTATVKAKRVKGNAKTARRQYRKLLNKGRKLTRQKRYEEAIAAYQEALTHDPNNATVLGEMGFTAQKMKRYKLAQKLAALCVRQTQKFKIQGACYYNLGRALESQGNKAGAARAYQASLKVRPNKVVAKRLKALGVKVERPATPSCANGECETLTWEELCAHLKGIATDEFSFESSEAQCKRTASRKVNESHMKGLAIIEVQTMGESLHFIAFKVGDKQWLPAGNIAYTYNPGAFGISEDASIRVALRDLIGGDGASEVVVSTEIARRDIDMGVAEEENTTIVMDYVCELHEGQAQCYGPVLRSREYIRESVEGLSGEPGVGDNSKLPIKRSYKASISYPAPGQIKVKRRSGKTSEQDVSYGTFQLRELPKTTLSVASR